VTELIDQVIGNYRIEALLGKGGMGQVYRARHLRLDTLRALKVLHPNLALDPTFQARFLSEAKSAATLNHPNIVAINDYDERDGRAFIVMELITGGSLRRLTERGVSANPVQLTRTLDLVRQAADALAYAHALGMVHRDIKPDNMLLQPAGEGEQPVLKVADFGLAKMAEGAQLTAVGMTMGTPAYMSPEQCQGLRDLDGRSDIYSLGVVLFELATGALPFDVRTMQAAIYQHVNVPAPSALSQRPELPADLDAIIARCLAKRPDERFSSAADLAAALRELLAGGSLESFLARPSTGARTTSAGPTQIQTPGGSVPTPSVQTVIGGSSLPRIQVLNAEGRLLQVVAVRPGGLRVGRVSDSDIHLDDKSVSRNHLRVEWDGAQVTLTDLGSHNGTALGDEQLAAERPHVWPWRTLARVGAFWLRLDPPDATVQAVTDGNPPTLRVPVYETQAVGTGTMRSGPQTVFSSAGRVTAVLDPEALVLTPGQPANLKVVLGNNGPTPDVVTLSVSGVSEEWVTLPPPTRLDPGIPTTTTITVLAPEGSGSRAGEYSVEVRARSRERPDESGKALARWTVRPVSHTTLTLDPRQGSGSRRAAYRVLLRNEGNAPASFRLSGEDSGAGLNYSFTPQQVTLEPGTEARAALTVEGSPLLLGGGRRHEFMVQAKSGDANPLTAEAAFVQRPLLAAWMLVLPVLALLAAAVVFGGGLLSTSEADGGQTAGVNVAIGTAGQQDGTATTLATPAGQSQTETPSPTGAQATGAGETATAEAQSAVAVGPAAEQQTQTAQTEQAGAQSASETQQAQQAQGAATSAPGASGPAPQQQTQTAQAANATAATATALAARATAAAQATATVNAAQTAFALNETAVILTTTALAQGTAAPVIGPTVTATTASNNGPTSTPTITPTLTATNTPTATPTSTPSATPTPTQPTSTPVVLSDNFDILSVTPLESVPFKSDQRVELDVRYTYSLAAADSAIIAIYVEQYVNTSQICSGGHNTNGGIYIPISRGQGELSARVAWNGAPSSTGALTVGANYWTNNNGSPGSLIRAFGQYTAFCFPFAP
jgi:eukaryotic-like serine/threonine-protein kinase